jgi:O-methyltransferase
MRIDEHRNMSRLPHKIRRLASRAMYGATYKHVELQLRDADVEPAFWNVWERVADYTMTPPMRAYAMYEALKYIDRNELSGAIVECGVWRGGSSMLAALTTRGRDLYLYDTFAGMPEPTDADVAWHGRVAMDKWRARQNGSDSGWCVAGIDEVRHNLASTGYPQQRLHFVAGPVEQTLPATAPDIIALLRIDTDFFESTRHELKHLYPRLVRGGVLIVDDYGHWNGARRAVDDYFEQMRPAPLLHRIDYAARLAVKP